MRRVTRPRGELGRRSRRSGVVSEGAVEVPSALHGQPPDGDSRQGEVGELPRRSTATYQPGRVGITCSSTTVNSVRRWSLARSRSPLRHAADSCSQRSARWANAPLQTTTSATGETHAARSAARSSSKERRPVRRDRTSRTDNARSIGSAALPSHVTADRSSSCHAHCRSRSANSGVGGARLSLTRRHATARPPAISAIPAVAAPCSSDMTHPLDTTVASRPGPQRPSALRLRRRCCNSDLPKMGCPVALGRPSWRA